MKKKHYKRIVRAICEAYVSPGGDLNLMSTTARKLGDGPETTALNRELARARNKEEARFARPNPQVG